MVGLPGAKGEKVSVLYTLNDKLIRPKMTTNNLLMLFLLLLWFVFKGKQGEPGLDVSNHYAVSYVSI